MTDTPTATAPTPIRPSDDIKRRLRAGEGLTSKQVASDYGVSSALLHAVLRELQLAGCTFQRDKLDGSPGNPLRFTITEPKPPRGSKQSWGPADNVVKLKGRGPQRKVRSDKGKARTRRAPAAAPPANGAVVKVDPAVEQLLHSRNGKGNTALDHPVPQLGESVQVFLLALDEDGKVNVGLRSSDATWLVGVDGFAARS